MNKIPKSIMNKINYAYKHSLAYDERKEAAIFGYNLSLQQLKEKDAIISELSMRLSQCIEINNKIMPEFLELLNKKTT